MGTWGVGLYDNDLAADMQQFVFDMQEACALPKEIAAQVAEGFSFAVGDDDDEPAYWLALTDIQLNLGYLSEDTKQQVLSYIESGRDEEIWSSVGAMETATRKKVIDSLHKKILSPPKVDAPKRKRSHTKASNTSVKSSAKWRKDEVYALPISDLGEEAREYMGRYLIFHVIGTIEANGKPLPRVRIKLTEKAELPLTEEALNRAEYVPNTISDGYKISLICKNVPSATPVYQSKIFNTTSQYMPKNIAYIGTFPDLVPPQSEYVPPDICIQGYVWKFMEKHVVDHYRIYNLKQSPLFHPK